MSSACGSKSFVAKKDTTITFPEISVGDACTYDIQSPCGFPSMASKKESKNNYFYSKINSTLNGPFAAKCQPTIDTVTIFSMKPISYPKPNPV